MYNNIMGYSWLCRDSVGSIIEVMYTEHAAQQWNSTSVQKAGPCTVYSAVMCRVKNNNYLYTKRSYNIIILLR